MRTRAFDGKGGSLHMTQVLTIDDSRAVRLQVRSILEAAGFQVLEAENGQDGLDRLRALSQPIVVLLDYQMPVMDGAEMLATVAREGAPLVNHEYLVLSAFAGTFPDTLIELVRTLSIRVLAKTAEPSGEDVWGKDLLSAVQQAHERLSAPPDENIFPTLPEL